MPQKSELQNPSALPSREAREQGCAAGDSGGHEGFELLRRIIIKSILNLCLQFIDFPVTNEQVVKQSNCLVFLFAGYSFEEKPTVQGTDSQIKVSLSNTYLD